MFEAAISNCAQKQWFSRQRDYIFLGICVWASADKIVFKNHILGYDSKILNKEEYFLLLEPLTCRDVFVTKFFSEITPASCSRYLRRRRHTQNYVRDPQCKNVELYCDIRANNGPIHWL